ncbi:MAG: YceI family protein [Luteolibacter sp.]
MNAEELREGLAAAQVPLLVHVLPEEIFAASRIAGSVNACVYETAFLANMETLAPDKTQPVIVYGAGGDSLDAVTAREKLLMAGYSDVDAFTGGLAEWRAAGFPIESGNDLPAAPELDGRFAVDVPQSVVRWTGRNLYNFHTGTVRLGSGEIVLKQGELITACFSIDMNSIACEDLTDPTWNAMLLRHLHDADFFEIATHPSAEFVATRATKIDACTEGTSNYLLSGNFTLRGVTRPLAFPILVALAADGSLTGQCQFELDRTQFGSRYGSGRFFQFLGKHVVNDLVHLHVKIHAVREG